MSQGWKSVKQFFLTTYSKSLLFYFSCFLLQFFFLKLFSYSFLTFIFNELE